MKFWALRQRRGVQFLAPVIESLKQLGRYTDAELVAAVVSGMFTVFIEKGDASGDEPLGAMQEKPRSYNIKKVIRQEKRSGDGMRL